MGIPCSGKSTLSWEFEKNYNFNSVSTDAIKKELIKKKINFELVDLFLIQREMFKSLIKKKVNITSDSNSDLIRFRRSLKKMANDNRYVSKVIYIDVSIENAYKRFLKRKKIKSSPKIHKVIFKSREGLQIPKKCYVLDGNLSKKKYMNEISKIKFY